MRRWIQQLDQNAVIMTCLVSMLLVSLFLFLHHTPLGYTDIWAHLRYGSWIVEHQQIPVCEPLSPWSEEKPFIPTAWLSQTFMWGVYRAGSAIPFRWTWNESIKPGGIELLRTLLALLVVLRFLFLYWAFCRWTKSRLVSFLGVLFSVVLCWHHLDVLRPQVWGELCLAIILFLVCRTPPTRLATWLVPVVMVLWSNLHGSYLNGLLILLGLLVGRFLAALKRCVQGEGGAVLYAASLRRTFRMFCYSVLAIGILNPYFSFRWYSETLSFAQNANVRTMDEWQRVEWHTPQGRIFLSSLCILAATQLLAMRYKVPGITIGHGLLILCFGIQVAFFQRMLPWWAIICPLVCVGPWSRLWALPVNCQAPVSIMQRAMQAIVMLVSCWIAVSWSPLGPLIQEQEMTKSSVSLHAATPTMLDLAADRRFHQGVDLELYRAIHRRGATIFCSETLGDYVFFCHRTPVIVFTHVQLFSTEHWRRCMVVKEGIDTWEQYLEQWNAQVVAVEAELHPHLCQQLRQSAKWHVVLDEAGSTSKSILKSRLFIAARK